MKRQFNDLYRLMTISVLIASLSMVAIGSMESAFAMPGTGGSDVGQANVPTSGTQTYKIIGNTQASTFAPHTNGQIALWHATNPTNPLTTNTDAGWNNGQANLGICQLDVTSGNRVWRVDDGATGNPATYSIPTGGTIDSSFPGGSAMVASGGASVTGAANWVWYGLGVLDTPDLDLNGGYVYSTCGNDNGQPAAYVENDPFSVVTPIGGQILPIDTTALVLAGFSVGLSWIIPAMIAVTGTGIVAYKLRK